MTDEAKTPPAETAPETAPETAMQRALRLKKAAQAQRNTPNAEQKGPRASAGMAAGKSTPWMKK